MKIFNRRFAVVLFGTIAVALMPSLSHAQNNQYFNGGTGVWDDGVTTDWDGSSVWTNGDVANFGSASTVTVDDSSGMVDAAQIYAYGAGTTTISGDTIDLSYSPGDYTWIKTYNSGASLTIDSKLELGDSGGDVQYIVDNSSGGTMTFSNIDFGPSPSNYSGNDGRMQLDSYDNGAPWFSPGPTRPPTRMAAN